MRREDLLGGPSPTGSAPQEALRYGTVLRYERAVVMVVRTAANNSSWFYAFNLLIQDPMDDREEGQVSGWYNTNWEVVE